MKYSIKQDLNLLPVIGYFGLWLEGILAGYSYLPNSIPSFVFYALAIPLIIYLIAYRISKIDDNNQTFPD